MLALSSAAATVNSGTPDVQYARAFSPRGIEDDDEDEWRKARNGPMSYPIIMHVNYCEQGQTLEEICRKAVNWGYDGVEFRRRRSGVEETDEQYLDELARCVALTGLEQVIFGGPGPNFMQADAAARHAELESYQSFFRLATARFKLTVCNTMAGGLRNPDPAVPSGFGHFDKHGSAAATDEHWQWAAESFRVLGDMAAAMGFRFAFEVHMGLLHDLPASTRKLVDEIGHPAVGANLDYGNVFLFKQHPPLEESISLLSDRLYYLHLKNYMPLRAVDEWLPTSLGDGAINHREFVKLLIKYNYTGPICVEAPRPGDREWYAQQDVAYIKSVVAECAD